MENFSVTILGSSSASPTIQRNTSAQLVNFYNRFYLIDCGEGTQMQLKKNRIKISKIHHILISHLHGDHFFGLVGLISSQNLFGRKKDLHIYSDIRIKQAIEIQLELSETILQFEIIYHELNFEKKDVIFEDKKLKLSSFPLDHRIPTCGFHFEEKESMPNINKTFVKNYEPSIEQIYEIRTGADFITKDNHTIPNKNLVIPAHKPRSFAYCSDTKYFPELSANFKDVELLYSECTFMKDFQKIAEDKFHMTTEDAVKIANESNAKQLIVGHFSARYKDIGYLQQEIVGMRSEVRIVEDNETYHVREEKK